MIDPQNIDLIVEALNEGKSPEIHVGKNGLDGLYDFVIEIQKRVPNAHASTVLVFSKRDAQSREMPDVLTVSGKFVVRLRIFRTLATQSDRGDMVYAERKILLPFPPFPELAIFGMGLHRVEVETVNFFLETGTFTCSCGCRELPNFDELVKEARRLRNDGWDMSNSDEDIIAALNSTPPLPAATAPAQSTAAPAPSRHP